MTQQTPIFNQEHAILQDVWRQAHSMPEGWTVDCRDQATAIRTRFSLYNAVKHFRSGKYEADSTLKAALEECSISFTPDKTGLIIRKKVMTGLLPDFVAKLGGMPKATQEIVELEHGQAFAARMQQLTEEVEEEKPKLSDMAAHYGARS